MNRLWKEWRWAYIDGNHCFICGNTNAQQLRLHGKRPELHSNLFIKEQKEFIKNGDEAGFRDYTQQNCVVICKCCLTRVVHQRYDFLGRFASTKGEGANVS